MRSSDYGHDTVRWLSVFGMVGPIVFWVVVFTLGFLTPGYSAVSDVVSLLGAVGAPYAVIQQVNFGVGGIGILAFAVGLDRRFREGWRPWIGVVLTAVLGIGLIGAGVFPLDPANPEAMTNLLHIRFALIISLAGLLGVPLTAWRIFQEEQWPGYESRYSVVGVTLLVVGSFILFFVSNGAWRGLGQRLFAGVLTGWIAYHSFRLYQLTAT